MICTRKSTKLAALAAALLSLLMLMSLCVVPAFAEEVTTEAATETVTDAATEAGTGDETDAGTAVETEAGTGSTTEAVTDASTDGAETEEEEAKKVARTTGIINLIVGGVLVLAIVILCIKFRAKIPGWWKALKSECGKISWCPWDKLKKNSWVVILIILAFVILVGVLDYAFSAGIKLLGELIG